MLEEYHKKTENTLLGAIQQAQVKSLDFKTYDKQEMSSNSVSFFHIID